MNTVTNIVDPLSSQARSALASAESLVPLKSLRHGFLEELFAHVESQSLAKGQAVFHEGTVDHQVIYLSSGSLSLNWPSGYQETVSASEQLVPIANQQPRVCDAYATEDAVVLRMDSDRLDRALSWSQITDYMLSELAMDRELDGDLEWYQMVLSSNLFFKVPSINVREILDAMTPVEVCTGDEIIVEGDHGDCCYFLRTGEADILKADSQGEQHCVAKISSGRCFGEDALLDLTRRNATVKMTSDGSLMRLDKQDFLKLLKEPSVDELDLKEIDQLHETPIWIDVRTNLEYGASHLAYSANMPLSNLALKRRLLSLHECYVLYCDTGRRSRSAAYFLGKEGFNVISLAGGLLEQGMTENLVEDSGYLLRDGKLLASEA